MAVVVAVGQMVTKAAGKGAGREEVSPGLEEPDQGAVGERRVVRVVEVHSL